MLASSPAVRVYNRRIIILSLIYGTCLFAAVYAFDRHLLNGPIAWVAALAPALPIIGMFAAIGRYLVEERDEYLRDQMARQSLIATGVAMSVATGWGFLENFGLVRHVYVYAVAIVWFAGLGIGTCVLKLVAPRGER